MNAPVRPRAWTRRRIAIAVLAAALAGGAGIGVLMAGPEDAGRRDLPDVFKLPDGERGPDFDIAGFEPFEYDAEHDDDLLERGRDAFSHVVYAKSPGGVEVTEQRVALFQSLIDRSAERHGVSADTLGALVFLESAGRAEVMASGDPESATGLAQILPGTATSLLGMRVDVARSRELTRAIDRNAGKAAKASTDKGRRLFTRRLAKARRDRRVIDERFDPAKAVDGAARYLAIAERRFRREDLAAASYHMGMGNLSDVIEAYGEGRVPFVRLYFDSSPTHNRRAYRRLTSFGDDSRHYLFRLEASREIRRLYRKDRDELRRLAGLHGNKASAEEVLRPPSDNEPFEDGDDLREAYDDGDLVPLPSDPARLGYRVARGMGSLARRLEERRELYRGLRPEALGLLIYISKEVRRLGAERALRVTSTVRDLGYQRLLVVSNPQATSGFSLHTTGFAIDIARSDASESELVHVLERLKALRVLDFVYEPGAIHLTAGPDAEAYLPLYEALVGVR